MKQVLEWNFRVCGNSQSSIRCRSGENFSRWKAIRLWFQFRCVEPSNCSIVHLLRFMSIAKSFGMFAMLTKRVRRSAESVMELSIVCRWRWLRGVEIAETHWGAMLLFHISHELCRAEQVFHFIKHIMLQPFIINVSWWAFLSYLRLLINHSRLCRFNSFPLCRLPPLLAPINIAAIKHRFDIRKTDQRSNTTPPPSSSFRSCAEMCRIFCLFCYIIKYEHHMAVQHIDLWLSPYGRARVNKKNALRQ